MDLCMFAAPLRVFPNDEVDFCPCDDALSPGDFLMVEAIEISSPDGLRPWSPMCRFSRLLPSLEVSFEERFLLGEPNVGGEKDGNDVKTFGDGGEASERLLCQLLFDVDEELVVRLPPRMVPAPVEPRESICKY